MYKIKIFLVAFYGCETWSFTLIKERKLRVWILEFLDFVQRPVFLKHSGNWIRNAGALTLLGQLGQSLDDGKVKQSCPCA
jgi:hypothetical protein